MPGGARPVAIAATVLSRTALGSLAATRRERRPADGVRGVRGSRVRHDLEDLAPGIRRRGRARPQGPDAGRRGAELRRLATRQRPAVPGNPELPPVPPGSTDR